MPGKGKKIKNITQLMLIIHRYLGFCLSLVFLFWFLSGFVMMYKDFPYLSQSEIWERSDEVPSEQLKLTAHDVIMANDLQDLEWASIKLMALESRPIYRLQDKEGNPYSYYGDTGNPLSHINKERASAIVDSFMRNSHNITKVEELDRLDQWIPRTRFLPYLPAYKVHIDDGKGTVYYVSSITGEVFQKLNRADKMWAWLGAIPHWIYFKDLRIHTQLWRDVVIFLSILGTIMCLAGLYMGVIRLRLKNRKWYNFSPYKKFWFKWHHYTGFVFGVITFTWVLSGLLSMNPWRWSPSNSLNVKESTLWQGGTLDSEIFSVDPAQAITSMGEKSEMISEIVYLRFDAQPYYLLRMSDGSSNLIDAKALNPPLEQLDTNLFVQQVQTIHSGVDISEVNVLQDYDAYYYDKHRTKPLPVIKISFDDHKKTTYYIDPKTTNVVTKYETKSRINRWLYHGLHSLDFPALYFKRPLWDIIVILLMLGGTSVSITGLVLTYKWLKRKIQKRST